LTGQQIPVSTNIKCNWYVGE